MRWILTYCFLLAALDIASTARPKRDLWPAKNYILSKLFGSDTVVIQLPNIPKNESYQLFRINGYDNIFLKVTRKPEKENEADKPVKVKLEDLVMVSPEMAIIGNYLGTSTQKETLLALDIAKNLLKSGVLRKEVEKVIPLAPQNLYQSYIVREPVKPVEVITKERHPIYVNQPFVQAETIDVVNRRPAVFYPPEHPPMVVASEITYKPFQTKFSYKQETEDADMTFESYNNHGVTVTRTNKVPVKPYYIALRLADVAAIAVKPQLVTSQPSMSTMITEQYKQFNVVPIHSYVTKKCLNTSPCTEKGVIKTPVAESVYVDSSYFNSHSSSSERNPESSPKVPESSPEVPESSSKVPEPIEVPMFISRSKLPFDIRDHLTDGEMDKLNQYINAKLELSTNEDKIVTSKPYNDEEINNDQKAVAGNSQIHPDKFVSRYSYKQLGDLGHENYTHVRIEDPKLNQSKINHIKSGDAITQNYVYVPPDVFIPPMDVLSSTNKKPDNVLPPVPTSLNDQSSHRYDDYENFTHDAEGYLKTTIPITLRGDQGHTEEATGKLQTNDQLSLTKNPIVVPEIGHTQNKVNNNRVTSSGRPHIGGENTSSTRKTNSAKLYTGGSGVRNGKIH